MSIKGLDGFSTALELNGEIEFSRNLEVNDIYVNGTIIGGGGIDKNVLITDNTWTGTNDFQNTFDISKAQTLLSTVEDNDLIKKSYADAVVSAYDPLSNDNVWNGVATFSTSNPVVPDYDSSQSDNTLMNLNSLNAEIASYDPYIATDNTWTGINDFQGGSISQAGGILPLDNEKSALTKSFTDGLLDIAGKTLTYSFTTAGLYPITPPDRPLGKIARIDCLMYAGGVNGTGGATNTPYAIGGAFTSFSIGNVANSLGSIIVKVGSAETVAPYLADYGGNVENLPNTSYVKTTSNSQSTSIPYSQMIGGVYGLHILNDKTTPVYGGSLSPIGMISVPDGTYLTSSFFYNSARNVGLPASTGRVDVIVHYI